MERHGQFPGSAIFRGWLARACDAEGDSARALELARQAVDQAAAQQQRGIHAWNRWHLAAILARAGDPDAERTFHEVLALAEELGMRPLQAHCHLGLGKLYRRVGRLDEARVELATAVAMLREMEMMFWLPEGGGAHAGGQPSVPPSGQSAAWVLTPGDGGEARVRVLAEGAAFLAEARAVVQQSDRRNASRIAAEIAALPAPEHAVALLERLGAERQPILGSSELA